MSFWIVMAVCMGCNPTEPASRDFIAELESKAFVGDTIQHHIRQKLMVQYAEFALTHPHDEFAPEALMRRADLLISAGKFEHAVLQLQDLHDGYPNYEKRALSAFLVAFVYDTHLHDLDLAKRAYERVTSLYPGTPEATMAEQSLALLPK